MLESVKIQRRQSEIRQSLAELVAKPAPTEDETRAMDALDSEYRVNETRYRAALIAEDTERREAGAELETRAGNEWASLIGRFELRQAALALDEGRALDGATAEVVAEMRQAGGYRGIPVPLEALEVRAGETIAAGTPDPVATMPIIERLFPGSVAAQMGAQMLNIPQGEREYPVVTQGATVGWATSETGGAGSAQAFEVTDRPLAPDYTLGAAMSLTRKSLKQSGAAVEAAVRRDMRSAIAQELDRVAFLGAGSSGEPLGVLAGASTYSITETAVDAAPDWAAFRAAAVRFMIANAAAAPSSVRVLIRPEMWADLDATAAATAAPLWELDRLRAAVGTVAISSNALAAYTGSPAAASALLTTNAGGVAPFFIATWGGVDLIRDPYTSKAAGGLELQALITTDVTVARPAQLEVLTGIQRPS